MTPLDVVRVRLQSQPAANSFSPLRTSTFSPSGGTTSGSSLGVTACCREVFWMNNNAQYCLAAPNNPAFNALSQPIHSTATSAANCAVEETQRKVINSTFDGLRKIAQNEGIWTLWRGLSPTLVMAIPGNVIYFTGYDYLRLNKHSPVRRYVSDGFAPLAAGSLARASAGAVVSPIEMFRTRMQAASNSGSGIIKETFAGVRDMVLAQGYSSLWRGLTLTMWRDVPFSAFYWWSYEASRNKLKDFRERVRGRALGSTSSKSRNRSRSRSRENHTATFLDSFVAGAASGAIASVMTTPFDVGKTRQQVLTHANDFSTPPNPPSSSKHINLSKGTRELMPEERSMPRFLYHIFQTEGLQGLFRGWAARTLKVAPACAIMISSYEIGKKMARRANERKDEKVP